MIKLTGKKVKFGKKKATLTNMFAQMEGRFGHAAAVCLHFTYFKSGQFNIIHCVLVIFSLSVTAAPLPFRLFGWLIFGIMIPKVNVSYLCLQTAVNKLDDSKLSSSAETPSHDGKKSDAPKAKEGRGRPAANAKSGSTEETVRLHHKTQWQWVLWCKIYTFIKREVSSQRQTSWWDSYCTWRPDVTSINYVRLFNQAGQYWHMHFTLPLANSEMLTER